MLLPYSLPKLWILGTLIVQLYLGSLTDMAPLKLGSILHCPHSHSRTTAWNALALARLRLPYLRNLAIGQKALIKLLSIDAMIHEKSIAAMA